MNKYQQFKGCWIFPNEKIVNLDYSTEYHDTFFKYFDEIHDFIDIHYDVYLKQINVQQFLKSKGFIRISCFENEIGLDAYNEDILEKHHACIVEQLLKMINFSKPYKICVYLTQNDDIRFIEDIDDL